jgi:sugar lactone lactonase YvrE
VLEATIDFAPLAGIRCALGESPVYDRTRDTLWFADILGRSLHRYALATGEHRTYAFASEVCSLGVAVSGRLVLALRKSVGLFDQDAGSFDPLAEIEPERLETRLNDGKVGPDGAFFVATMDDRPQRDPIGTLYRIDGAGRVEVKVTGLRTSNGLAFTADGRLMFHSDSRAGWIDRWRFDPATGAMSGRTRFATLDEAMGRPDGGATDEAGGYWSAGVSAGRLNRFAADGTLLAAYSLPVAAPTMPCFAGADLRSLFVTSATVNLTRERQSGYPLNGAVLTALSPVAGAPVSLFRDR